LDLKKEPPLDLFAKDLKILSGYLEELQDTKEYIMITKLFRGLDAKHQGLLPPLDTDGQGGFGGSS
jgi:hypothetical protein